MAVSSGVSFLVSLTLCLAIFGGMQMYKQQLAGQELMTVAGGFMGSLLFLFLLTAISSLEMSLFGAGFQSRLFPEVLGCLGMALFASGLVHRVCVTTCFLFSMISLYYVNGISQSTYSAPTGAAPPTATPGRRRKH